MIRLCGLPLMMLFAIVAIVGCSDGDDNPAPTAAPSIAPTEIVQQATPSDTPGGPTRTPSPTFRPTITSGPPTNTVPPNPTALPSATPEPWRVVVEEGDTCLEFALRYDVSVESIQAANTPLDCRVLGLGQQLVIPRPTVTTTPFGAEMTATAFFEALAPELRNVTPYALYEYCPEEGDTLRSMSLLHNTTDRRICDLNQLPDGLDCRTCEFRDNGMASCPIAPNISLNRCYNVPGPTYTPLPTSTADGAVTITPTPTQLPPQPFFPANNAMVADASIQLAWTNNSQLQPGQLFQVLVVDDVSGSLLFSQEVSSTNFKLPPELKPAPGSVRAFRWSVQVVTVQNGLAVPSSGSSQEWRFTWQPSS